MTFKGGPFLRQDYVLRKTTKHHSEQINHTVKQGDGSIILWGMPFSRHMQVGQSSLDEPL